MPARHTTMYFIISSNSIDIFIGKWHGFMFLLFVTMFKHGFFNNNEFDIDLDTNMLNNITFSSFLEYVIQYRFGENAYIKEMLYSTYFMNL